MNILRIGPDYQTIIRQMSSVRQKYVNWWARIKQGLGLKQEIRPIIKTQIELTIKSVSTEDGSYCNPNRTNGKKN